MTASIDSMNSIDEGSTSLHPAPSDVLQPPAHPYPSLTTPVQTKTKARRKKNTQEKCMMILTAGFIGGVLLLTFMPEGAVRGICLGLYSCFIYYALYKFGI
ncbi:MAG: hypothetical protein K2X66_01700 [Cyanobacteria bacterium]|nr:hypothetical protein [Cyanobacteriota bacterium]